MNQSMVSFWGPLSSLQRTIPQGMLPCRELTIVGMSVDLSNVTPGGIRELHLLGRGKMLDRDTLLMSMGPPDANLGNRDTAANTSQIYCLVVWSISQVQATFSTPSPLFTSPSASSRPSTCRQCAADIIVACQS